MTPQQDLDESIIAFDIALAKLTDLWQKCTNKAMKDNIMAKIDKGLEDRKAATDLRLRSV